MKFLAGPLTGLFMAVSQTAALAQLQNLLLPQLTPMELPPPIEMKKPESEVAPLPEPFVDKLACLLKGKYIGIKEVRLEDLRRWEGDPELEYFITKDIGNQMQLLVEAEDLSFAIFEHDECGEEFRYTAVNRHKLSEALHDPEKREGFLPLEELIKAEDELAHYRCTIDERKWVIEKQLSYPQSMAMCPPEI